DGWTVCRGRSASHHDVRACRPDGTDQLSDAIDHLRHALVRIRAGAMVASWRFDGDGDRCVDHCRTDPAQRLVAVALSLRAHRVDLAATDVRQASLAPEALRP